MLARPTKTTAKQAAKPDQAKPQEERFLLRVDGQTKRSFSSLDDAMAAGRQIKKARPVVVVTVMDSADGSSHPIAP
jgi:hypothetical protein